MIIFTQTTNTTQNNKRNTYNTYNNKSDSITNNKHSAQINKQAESHANNANKHSKRTATTTIKTCTHVHFNNNNVNIKCNYLSCQQQQRVAYMGGSEWKCQRLCSARMPFIINAFR